MKRNVHFLTQSAVLAAIYVSLTHLQNLLLPSSTSMAVQFRLSEALCVLAFFTPAAIPGLSLGCLLFNITSGAAALDFLIGTTATALATGCMWWTRKITFKGFPLLGMLMPGFFNAILVGWELSAFVGGSFGINALLVAIGELTVLLLPGSVLFYAIRNRKLL